MEQRAYMTIDGIPVAIESEKNLLEVIRKAGIKLPTFCYHSELSVYGACRMCMVETGRGELEAACSTPPRAGMQIKTNTERLRRYRKNILELLLANHCRDCTTCSNSGKCKLQDLAMRFDIRGVRFPNTASASQRDDSSLCITRDASKCILCGDCVRMCNEIQQVGAIDFAFRGSKMEISTAFGTPLAQTPCVGCGQCAAVCPTGAIVVRDDADKVWHALEADDVRVTAQIAPAVRVALGKEFHFRECENAMAKIVAALRRMGFDEVHDTAVGADLTVIEESEELLAHLERGETLPLFTSCCPAWVQYCEKHYPSLMRHVSTCRSPMQMFASLIKDDGKTSSRRQFHVAVMPCTAKKFEAARPEFAPEGRPNVDAVITTQELIRMIKESGVVPEELESDAVDLSYGSVSGAGVIFGVGGGVTEAVLRRLSGDKTRGGLIAAAYAAVRGMQGVKETRVPYQGRELSIAIVSGLHNADALIQAIARGEAQYDFVEVMACPGGCVSGAGQPYASGATRAERGRGLYDADRVSCIKRSEENPLVLSLYRDKLKGRVHELLHVTYETAGGEEG